jgi:hypothetical protein
MNGVETILKKISIIIIAAIEVEQKTYSNPVCSPSALDFKCVKLSLVITALTEYWYDPEL